MLAGCTAWEQLCQGTAWLCLSWGQACEHLTQWLRNRLYKPWDTLAAILRNTVPLLGTEGCESRAGEEDGRALAVPQRSCSLCWPWPWCLPEWHCQRRHCSENQLQTCRINKALIAASCWRKLELSSTWPHLQQCHTLLYLAALLFGQLVASLSCTHSCCCHYTFPAEGKAKAQPV